MKNNRLIGFVFTLITAFTFAQTEKESTGYAEVKLWPNSTIEKTKIAVIDAAKINAIENAFGSVVMEGNTLYTLNKQEGEKNEYNQIFNSISDVYVNGDWIKDLEKPKVERFMRGEEIFYKAEVKGIVRELKVNPATFIVKSLSCEKVTCETELFNNGQDYYLFVKVPNDGYISVYLDIPVENTSYRLLPYKQESNIGSVFLKADEEYIFFSPKKATETNKSKVDELKWEITDKTKPETNKLFVLYRPALPLEKPLLVNGTKNKGASDLELPLSLKSEEFQVWLQQLRSRNNDIQLYNGYITIKP